MNREVQKLALTGERRIPLMVVAILYRCFLWFWSNSGGGGGGHAGASSSRGAKQVSAPLEVARGKAPLHLIRLPASKRACNRCRTAPELKFYDDDDDDDDRRRAERPRRVDIS